VAGRAGCACWSGASRANIGHPPIYRRSWTVVAELPLKDLKFRCAKYGKRPRDMTIKAVVRRLLYALFSWPPSDADKRRIVSEVARQSSIRNLLGTETCEEMVAAQLPNFDKIITIDPDDRLCSSVLKRFAPHPNFDVANGASHQILPRVLLRFSGPVLCWMEGYLRRPRCSGRRSNLSGRGGGPSAGLERSQPRRASVQSIAGD
jgi:hypothetical protein